MEYDKNGRPLLVIDNPQFEPSAAVASSSAGLGAGTAGMLAGGAVSVLGGLAESWFNAREARKNRAWQERMSNTAYQRQMADMRAAGLNPILAASKGGGADVGGGATASAGNLSGGGAAVRESARLNAIEKPLMEGQLAQMRAQASAAEAQAANTDMNTEMQKKLIESNILVNKAQARSVNSATDSMEKGGAFVGKYLPRTWIESLDDMLRGGKGNGYGGPHKAKE